MMKTKDDDALLKLMVKAMRKRQQERTSSGRAYDDALPPTEAEIDNIRGALAVARKAILEEAATAFHDAHFEGKSSVEIYDAILALGEQ